MKIHSNVDASWLGVSAHGQSLFWSIHFQMIPYFFYTLSSHNLSQCYIMCPQKVFNVRQMSSKFPFLYLIFPRILQPERWKHKDPWFLILEWISVHPAKPEHCDPHIGDSYLATSSCSPGIPTGSYKRPNVDIKTRPANATVLVAYEDIL